MAFLVTGDIHGTLDIGKVVKFFEGREEKYYVIYRSQLYLLMEITRILNS